MNQIDEKSQTLNEYNEEQFTAYQRGYKDGQKSGMLTGVTALREMLLNRYHELPTTLGYTEQIIDFCIDAILNGKEDYSK